MHSIGRAVAATMLGLALPLAAPARSAEPVPAEPEIRALIDRGDWIATVRAIDQRIEARLVAGAALRPDPVLDRLIGETFAAFSPGLARILLERAVADPTTADRPRYALLLAGADEMLGDSAAAEAIYRRLLAEPTPPAGRRLAALGLARLLLIGRPREALQVAAELIGQQRGPADRWEAELLAARAARMLGMDAEAVAYLDQASQHAWSAPVGDAAVARIALDRAAVAGLAGDRQTLIALSAVSRSGRQSTAGRQFMQLLPECGLHGITARDFVILELMPRLGSRVRIGLIQASRPEIAAPFIDMVARTPLQEPSGQAMSVLLRCTTAPRAGAAQAWDSPIIEWAARQGAYPDMWDYQEPDFATIQARLAAREARLGADSPHLIPTLARLLDTSAQAAPATPDEAERLRGYARRLNDLLAAQQAPADARLPGAMAATILNAIAVQQTQQATSRAIRATLETAAADPEFATESLLAVAEALPGDWELAPAVKAALLAQALERLRGTGADPRQRGLAVRLISLRRELGDEAGAAALQRSYGIAEDLCAAAPGSRYLSSDIRAEDYPVDAVIGNIFGQVGIDLATDAAGVPRDIRLVMALPPFVFDAATAARAPTIRYRPVEIGGAARACRGQSQTVNWQLPQDQP